MTVQYFDDYDVACFDGLSFRRDKKTGYYLNSKIHKRLHVYVWEYYNGKIPKGFHVHHKDFNKRHNDIENLVLMEAKAHLSLHGKRWDDERYKKHIKILKEKAVPKATEWHKSKEGREWHKEHFEKYKEQFFKKELYKCLVCGKEYESVNHGNNKFCSNACKSAYRRKLGVDNETRKCAWCGKEFTTSKYSKGRTCSGYCRNKLRWDKKNKENR